MYELVAGILNADSEPFKCVGTHAEAVVGWAFYKHIVGIQFMTKTDIVYYA